MKPIKLQDVSERGETPENKDNVEFRLNDDGSLTVTITYFERTSLHSKRMKRTAHFGTVSAGSVAKLSGWFRRI